MRLLTTIAAALLLLASCTRDDAVIGGIMAMADVRSATSLTTDEGLSLNVISDLTDGTIGQAGRAVIQADVLRTHDDGTLDIRLTSFQRVLTKPVVTTPDGATLGNDPITLQRCWRSSHYINTLVAFRTDPASSASHIVNLVYEGIKSAGDAQPDTLIMRLRHNAGGSGATEPVSAWASFDINTLSQAEDAPIIIKCLWEGESQTFRINR